MYTKTNWQDEVVDADTGETIQQGFLRLNTTHRAGDFG
jgi:hypothetical protein